MDARKTLNKLRSGGGTTATAPGTGTGGGGGFGVPPEGGQTASQKLGLFPPLNVKGTNLHLIEPRKPSELAMSDVQKVRCSCSNFFGLACAKMSTAHQFCIVDITPHLTMCLLCFYSVFHSAKYPRSVLGRQRTRLTRAVRQDEWQRRRGEQERAAQHAHATVRAAAAAKCG